MKKSFLTCPHNNVQQFTECCLDCGYNIYTTKEEYYHELLKKLDKEDKHIHDLEDKLGIKR